MPQPVQAPGVDFAEAADKHGSIDHRKSSQPQHACRFEASFGEVAVFRRQDIVKCRFSLPYL